MGGRQSKARGQILYEQAVRGNFRSLAARRNQGTDLEWVDEQGKTSLIVACSRQDLFKVAETLIELGSNVNAYSPGSDGVTPLHHAAKSGLLQTVKLLLSHGANIYKRNDKGQTPLDVAREEEKADIVHAIEVPEHMCIFSGWLREFNGPVLHEVVATSWVVIVPTGPFSPPEISIYANLLSTKPSKVISLRLTNIEEPNFKESDPSLIIYDKFTKTRYKFASGIPGDWRQIQWLYDACRGIHEVPSRIRQHNTQTSAPSNGSQIVVENKQPSSLINSSSTEISEENGWGNATRDSTLNGWGSLVGPTPSKLTNGWMDMPPKEEFNGWGSVGAPTTSEANKTKVIHNDLATAVASIPSAPPLPYEDFHYDPFKNLGQQVDCSADTCNSDEKTLRTGEAKDGSGSSSSCCVICWEMPAEGACVPCGHMAACMACLNDVKSNRGDCPVCRAKIDQIIRIYVA